MESKKLVPLAVASTIGWSAAAFAGAGQEVVTPFSPNESGEVLLQLQQERFGSTQTSAMGGLSDHRSGTIGGSYDSMWSSTSFSTIGSEPASTSDSVAAGDQGIYSEYYLVGWAPSTVDYYVIDNGRTPEIVAISQFDVWMPTHELALTPSSSDEMVYELTLLPMTFDGGSADAAD